LGTFKIKNLATSNCVKDWGNCPRHGLGREAPCRISAEDAKLVRRRLDWQGLFK